ncbi:MAG: hypothetical protein L0219_18195 [Phycisphaerales bacterium]|nr:hypothetical protein [Phycisphaerales bacterium]
MSELDGGFERFGEELNPAVVDEVLGWERDKELGRIVRRLRSHANRKAFLDTYAEAMVARRLKARGCKLKFEVPTPAGRRSDFEVDGCGRRFYLHVKRIDTDRPGADVKGSKRLVAQSAKLRALERIARPYVVQVRWHDWLNAAQMKRLVDQAGEFIRQARVGDEMKASDAGGRELGGVRVIAPWDGSHIYVTIGLPSGFVDQAPRFRRLMHRAYQQFMPRQTNVIVICSGHPNDVVECENGLLGSHIERWDAFPPVGKRVAHGRGADGFWNGQRYAASRFVAWFGFSPGDREAESRLWVRREMEVDGEMEDVLKSVFEDGR